MKIYKKQVQVVGISHRVGSKQDGKNYDFYQLHVTYEDSSTEGIATSALIIPDYVATNIDMGKPATLFSHFAAGREYFDDIYQ